MDLQLHNQHVLITGGSRGIGWACAHQFLAEGARVTLVARSADGLAAARERLVAVVGVAASQVHTQVANLCDPTAAADMLARAQTHQTGHGPVDVLVNCAGAAQRTPPNELQPATWQAALQAKFFSYINVIDPLIKEMGQRGRGVVVNVVGMGGKVASPIHLPGGSANAALMLASAGLAAAYAPLGVRVNVVNPAMTQTERLTEGLAAEARLRGSTPDDVLARTVAQYPMGRIAQPAEIANAVVFLA
ncbi:MAG: hypothetical protein RJA09_1294, partial [Pseudomonadota bacterium]